MAKKKKTQNKKEKRGFILKMMPGSYKTQKTITAILTLILFILSISITFETINSFYNESHTEAFSERVANTQVK